MLLGSEAAGRWPRQLAGYEIGNTVEDGLVRGAEFVMIWTFLVSRGYSAASCSATQRNCCARIHSAFPGYKSGPSELGPAKGKNRKRPPRKGIRGSKDGPQKAGPT